MYAHSRSGEEDVLHHYVAGDDQMGGSFLRQTMSEVTEALSIHVHLQTHTRSSKTVLNPLNSSRYNSKQLAIQPHQENEQNVIFIIVSKSEIHM